MSIGSNIKMYRNECKLTQEQVADKIGVSFQAVSSWERDEYKPETDNLIKLAELFDTSVSALIEDKLGVFHTKDAIYNWEHMKTYVKTTAENLKMNNTLKAMDFALEAHKGQTRKKSDIPYIYHPLSLACHALAMNIEDDKIIAACLLHDVVEDCGKTVDELPVDEETREIVRLLTHGKTTSMNRETVMREYYEGIVSNPKAALIKCMDRCHNVTNMALVLSREKIYRTIRETEEYFPALIAAIKAEPEYNDAAWLLRYQIDSMIEIYKRLL